MSSRDITFENKLWKAADKLRKKVEVHDYKYVVLGLIFLRYISFAFDKRRNELETEFSDSSNSKYISSEKFRNQALEDRDYYLSAGALFVPPKARWSYLVENATQPNIGELIDNAIEILEDEYPRQLRDVIPKIYTEINLDNYDFAYLLDLFTSIQFTLESGKDVFGRIYEYFLGKFAAVEGKKGGQFYTPRSLTNLIIDVLDVKSGRIFDPACGSGGFFVSALNKIEEEGIDKNKLSILGQESIPMPWKICKMNLTLRGAEGDIRIGDSYHDDKFLNLQADFVVSNPPFNDSEWGADRVAFDDPRFKYGIPSDNNGNFAWIQQYIYHLAPSGKAGFVMANGALSIGGEDGKIRKKIVDDDLVFGIVACPSKLFYNVTLAVSLWFIRTNRSKPPHMKRKVLFIHARKLFKEISKRQVVFTEEHLAKITNKFRLFEMGKTEEVDEIGFSKIASIDEIAQNSYFLNPGRYVGIKDEENYASYEESISRFSLEMIELTEEQEKLEKKIREVIESLEQLE